MSTSMALNPQLLDRPSQPEANRVPSARGTPTQRNNWLANLRSALTVLVMIHHSSLVNSNFDAWPYWSAPQAGDQTSVVLNNVVLINQTFFMGLFFLISGIFVPRSYDRYGFRRFLTTRLTRLGVPWLVYVVVLQPLYALPLYLSTTTDHGFGNYAMWIVHHFDPGAMWFVEVLFAFNVIYALTRLMAHKYASVLPRFSLRMNLSAAAMICVCVAGLSVASLSWRYFFPDGTSWPYVGIPSVAYLPQYIVLFALGVWAGPRRWLERIPVKVGSCYAIIALIATYLYVSGMARGDLSDTWRTVLTAVMCLAINCALVVLFRELTNVQSVITRFFSDNSLAVYVLHPPVLVWLSLALDRAIYQGGPPSSLCRALVLFAVASIVVWPLASLVRRIPRVGPYLS